MLNIFNWKYRFFGKKIKQVRNAIADLEFKLFKVREMREERRKQRDMAVQNIEAISKRLDERLPEEEKEKFLAQKAEQENYLKHVTDQIDALDIEINGAQATETTNEYNGVVQQIEAAVQLLAMYQEYRKSL